MIDIKIKKLIQDKLQDLNLTVHWYNMQYLNTESDDPIKYPAAFIEIADLDWHDAGAGLQTAPGDFTIHVVQDSTVNNPEGVMVLSQQAFLALNRQFLVDPSMPQEHQFITSELVRRRSGLVLRYKKLKIFKLRFACTVFDSSGMDPFTEVAPPDFVIPHP